MVMAMMSALTSSRCLRTLCADTADMVSLVDGDEGVGKRGRALRHRKQKLMSTLSDSGFEEDLQAPSPAPHANVSPLRLEAPEPPAEPLSTWYLQYGDVGYNIQRQREAHEHPCTSLARQPQLTAEARCKLVSWLIPVHKHFRLSFECCCLAVNIMDRFLASTAVAVDCFQLLGVTALLLASKQVEVCSPPISHLLSLCCDAFTKEQLCNLECLILLRLNYRLTAPTLAFFLDYYTNCMEAAQLQSEAAGGERFDRMNGHSKRPRRCSNLAQKVCELSLADYAFTKYPASLTACCALNLASELLGPEHDNPTTAKGHGVSLGPESYNHSLAQECKDNLKLLLSLNQGTLEAMSTM